MQASSDYRAFLRSKIKLAQPAGFDIDPAEINPILKPHQRAIVQWAVRGGKRAVFASFGLGKSVMQIEIVRLVLKKVGGRGLIVAPLGVRGEFLRDAAMLGIDLKFIRRIEEAGAEGLYLTNYETVRDGKLDPSAFALASLDEASILRGFGGTKTFREFMARFANDARREGASGEVRYRFVATATPSPNEFIELLSYAAFLGIMDVGQAKTRWFQRNSEKNDDLTLYPHKADEFWKWVASWAVFVQRPSDLGFDDTGYALPEMTVRWHEVPSDHSSAGADRSGQTQLFRDAAASLADAARERRDNLAARMHKLEEIVSADPDSHRLIWHDLEAERHAIKKALPEAVTVWGSQEMEEREQAIADFSAGKIKWLATKPVLAGSGCNFQYHCHKAVFLGVGYKFNDFIQACHRIHRFLQDRPVEIDIIYSEAERGIRAVLEEKWARHDEQAEIMSALIREHGLGSAALADGLVRTIGCDRDERRGESFRLVHNDCVEELRSTPENSADLIVTSIPFEGMYEYSPSYNDFGHSESSAEFWAQMDFLIPELLRVLKPGRVCAIHVKDRITPGGINGFGFQTVTPVSDFCTARFTHHGFAFLARKTITTDVVRENNQTYRLGWSEQCKDGSRMGAGLPEYLMLFRKAPTDRSNGYADTPVVKQKPLSHDRAGNVVPYELGDAMIPHTGYSRSRWQIDAHGYMRSSGDKLIAPEDLVGLEVDAVWKIWKQFSLTHVYDFEHHVACCEAREAKKELPKTFFLLPPHSWHPDVWSDITRMRTLNGAQSASGRELHICPLQFDIVDRVIAQFSMPGEVVLDPFAGIGTVPFRAVKLKRFGAGIELNADYFRDSIFYCEQAERDMAVPSLFDLLEANTSSDGDGEATATAERPVGTGDRLAGNDSGAPSDAQYRPVTPAETLTGQHPRPNGEGRVRKDAGVASGPSEAYPEPAEGNDPDQNATGGMLIPSMAAEQSGELNAGETVAASASASQSPALLAPGDPAPGREACEPPPGVFELDAEQLQRRGALLAVAAGESVDSEALRDLVGIGFVHVTTSRPIVTEEGQEWLRATAAARRLDDLGSVQDGRKMSTDGQPADGLRMSDGERQPHIGATAGETVACSSVTAGEGKGAGPAPGRELEAGDANAGETMCVTAGETATNSVPDRWEHGPQDEAPPCAQAVTAGETATEPGLVAADQHAAANTPAPLDIPAFLPKASSRPLDRAASGGVAPDARATSPARASSFDDHLKIPEFLRRQAV